MNTARTPKTLAAGSAAVVAAALLAGCGASKSASGGGGGDDESGSSSKALTIPIASGWDEDIAATHLWKYVLEKKGYTVQTPGMDVGVIFNGISQGTGSNADLFFDTALPITHKSYWKKIHNKVEDLGPWYDQMTNELAVPTYLKDVNSIADLKGRADEFDGRITGIDPGAGLTAVTKDKAMPDYGLDDYTLKTSSTAAMLAALKKATDEKEPIVVTLWHPHWAYSAFPIKDLGDPKNAMGDADKIHVIARQGFTKEHPDVAKALKDFAMDDKTLASLEEVVLREHKEDPDAGVKAWIEKSKANQDYVDSLGQGLK
jgi:glycine betaine/proline transport system substrate-binding protein